MALINSCYVLKRRAEPQLCFYKAHFPKCVGLEGFCGQINEFGKTLQILGLPINKHIAFIGPK